MKRVLASSQFEDKTILIEYENVIIPSERSPKKLKRDFTERINKVVVALKEINEEHENNRVETQNKIEEVCNTLREAVDNLEKRLIDDLQQNYTKEESRLQESLYKVGMLCYDDNENMNDEEKDKVLMKAESTMCCVQRYKLSHPNFEDVSKWANDTLLSEFNLDISQSFSDEIKERIPRITEVRESGPNEVHIDLKFLNEYEEAAMKRMDQWSSIEYIVEIWNGEKGEDYEVKGEQILGPSHKAYIEWRHIGGSECKVRGKAVWTGLFGEKCESEWSEWKSFTVPEEHKNSGIFKSGAVWEKWKDGEMYTVIDKTTNIFLYRGTKPYTIIPNFAGGYEVLIYGEKGDTRWEKKMAFKQIPQTTKYLLEDLKLFHTERDICASVIGVIKVLFESHKEFKELDANFKILEAISNTMKNYIHDADICKNGLFAISKIASGNPENKNLSKELGCIELIKFIIKQHIDDIDVCINGFDAVRSVVSGSPANQVFACKVGFVELIKDVIKQHIGNDSVCSSGLVLIEIIVFRIIYNKIVACELGWVDFAFEIIEHHNDNKTITGWCYGCIKRLLSSRETYIKWCTNSVMEKIEEHYKKYSSSQSIENCLFHLKEMNDKFVHDISQEIYTKEATGFEEDCCTLKNEDLYQPSY